MDELIQRIMAMEYMDLITHDYARHIRGELTCGILLNDAHDEEEKEKEKCIFKVKLAMVISLAVSSGDTIDGSNIF